MKINFLQYLYIYPHDMNSVLQEIKDLERDRVQYNTKVDGMV